MINLYSVSGRESEKPVFTMLPPHYHNDWVWQHTVEILEQQDYESLLVKLPVGDPSMTLDRHAEIVSEAERKRGAGSYIEVGASWGADLAYRRKGGIPVSKLVFVGAPLRPVIRKKGLLRLIPNLANNTSLIYSAYVKGEEINHGEFDRSMLGDIFYRKLGNAGLKQWAIEHLEPHPHVAEPSDKNAILPRGTEAYYVGLTDDTVLPYESQKRTAEFLGIDFIPFPSEHIAMIYEPERLAELLIEIAEDRVNYGRWQQIVNQRRIDRLNRQLN